MTGRSIDELLSLLPLVEPDATFEARLRGRLERELAGQGDEQPAASIDPHSTSTSEVFELEATTSPSTVTKRVPTQWLRAAAAAAAVAVGAATVFVALQEDSTTTLAPPDATFVGATLETIAIDVAVSDPYFVAAREDTYVLSLAGDLTRISDTGGATRIAGVPEASPLALDDEAVWIADAVDGRVLRLDPEDGTVVAEIETGIEVQQSVMRVPMPEGPSRQFALIGGIVSSGDSVFVGDKTGRVLRIDPDTNEVVDTFDVPVRPDQLQHDGEHLLVVNLTGGQAAVVSTESGEVVHPVEEVDDLAGAALYGGALYLQDASDGTVTRIDLETGAERTSQPLGASYDPSGQPVLPTGLVVSAAGVLVDTATEPESLHILDPETLNETGTLAVTRDHGDMTVAPDGSVWLVRGNQHAVVRIVPRPL